MLNRLNFMREVYELSPCSVFYNPDLVPKQGSRALSARVKPWLLMVLVCCLAGWAQAQEICNNGIDDDNDGYVDCYDIDCSGNFACTSQLFGGAVPGCQYVPTPAPSFQMSLLWATDSIAQPLTTRRTPIIGDIDIDGVPEVITGTAAIASGTYVYNGANGILERTIASSPFALSYGAHAIGDIDNDGFGEILMVSQNSSGRQLLCYEHNGNLKWTSSTQVGFGVADETWTPLIADFEEDGLPEIYMGNQIFNGATGALIVSGTGSASRGANAGSPNEPFSVAADVLPTGFCADCAGLELVAGNTVYAINLLAGTMVAQNVPNAGMFDGMTSLADMDRDGDVDAVVVGQNGLTRGAVYIWDIQTGVVIASPFQIDGAANASGITSSGGLATIADLDNNGFPEVLVGGRNVLVALNFNVGLNNFSERWSLASIDNSGRLGCTVFDFEGDGTKEVVYRDDAVLRVLAGANGAVRFTTTCPSSSRMETPVVVDVDNNGQANIVCQCNNSVKAYQPLLSTWVPARGIWNQRSYFVLNVRDNLRIPRQQQGQELGFPVGAPVNYPFNVFMSQTTRLANNGAIVYPAANDQISILNPVADINLGPCQDGINDSIGLRLTVRNTGNAPIPIGTPISFYNGNPYAIGATFLRSYNMLQAVPIGGSLTLPFVYVDDQGGTMNLHFQINDLGTNPIPMTAPANAHLECNYLNNIGNLQVTSCGNLPPAVDTFGLQTDTILFTSFEDTPAQLCISATDPQSDAHDVTGLIGSIALGSATGLNDGDSCITLTPLPSSTGQSTFSLIICDNGNVPLCDTVFVIWTLAPLNDRPVALDDAITTNEDTPVSIPLLGNDFDAENDPLAVTLIGGPLHGTAAMNLNNLDYTPGFNYVGFDTIVYRVCDNALPVGCDTATIIITILPINDNPLAVDDSITLPNDTTQVNVPIIVNDSDPESGVLSITIGCPPAHGTATVNTNTLQIVYVPDPTYIGLDSLCYILCDDGNPVLCDTAYVYFNIFNGNEPPLAVDDMDTTLLQDTVLISIIPNDSDPNGDAFSTTALICGPMNGTVTLDTLLGILTYVPNVGYLGPDSICYVICDVPVGGPSYCDTAVVYIQVNTSNIPPDAITDTLTVAFTLTGTRDLLANDSDANALDSLFVTILLQPSNGTALLNNGVITYTPNPTFYGLDSLCYQLCDNGIPVMCDTACAYFTVLPPVDIIVPNGFSPNGDGANDFLVIDAVQLYPDNTFQVFTRWGTTVFEANGYNNEWDGTYKGNAVPDGTYFYRLDPGDGSDVITGFVLLYR
ncbi:MAG: tandem-95 repeat protein [Bacteroidetes bacterium]|nr:tandem-95 repeat protein [Bacteroidota bacterium]